MRFLGVGKGNDLADMYLRLQQRGHDVRVYVGDPAAHDIFAGMLTFSDDWQRYLEWVGREGIIIFEGVGWGETQDALRKRGFNVIGGSALGDRLETDRAFGQSVLHDAGLLTAASHEFDDFDQAIEFVRKNRARYVVKFSGEGFASTRNYVGAMDSGDDILAVLRLQRDRWTYDERPHFILMEHLAGIEVGVGAFFNGRTFLQPANLDWEHKRFFPGNLGELTGEMGTVVSYRGGDKLFEATLVRIAPLLRAAGHVGYVNLNMIINDAGVWPLEFTCRFGYPGFAVLEPLKALGWGELFRSMIRRDAVSFPTKARYSVCIVLSTPPFPYSRKEINVPLGLPVIVDGVEPEHLHWGEVGRVGEELVTSGLYGWTAVVTGTGNTIGEAQAAAYARAARVRSPNMRYRLDIGDKLLGGDLQRLIDWGWLQPLGD